MDADKKAVIDRGEPEFRMEPMVISENSRHWKGLADLAFALGQTTAGFRRSLPEHLIPALADLVRAMNCYYSNLIEGHHTHPVEIERALRGDYAKDPEKRNLQLEAHAHIEVHRWIDGGGLGDRAYTMDGIREVHRRFCQQLPEDLLWVEDRQSQTRAQVVPGAWRMRDVIVGQHVPVSPGAIPRLLRRYEQVYEGLGIVDSVVAAAAAHHRLLWIHPFLDGNGRVARLISHAALLHRLDTGGLWSVARGLAREVQSYRGHLANCDRTRRNDLDGRGNLSEEALAAFSEFFLRACLDQVRFMESLMEPRGLASRVATWAEEEVRAGRLEARSPRILEALLYRGEVPRGEVETIVGTSSRQARRIVSSLNAAGVIASTSPRAPLRMALPAALAARWLPGLFPGHAV